MRLLASSSHDAPTELAFDAALFHDMENGEAEESLRFWESPRPAVIVGYLAHVDREVHADACLADKVPIVRRLSGGGAVVVGRGCLNYTLILSLADRPDLRDVARSYQRVLARFVQALDIAGLSIGGASDLTIDGRKMSGCAQRRGRRALLHHGTLLYDFDLDLIPRYLKEPARRPTYRSGRSHLEFVANAPLAADELKSRIVAGVGANFSSHAVTPSV